MCEKYCRWQFHKFQSIKNQYENVKTFYRTENTTTIVIETASNSNNFVVAIINSV